MRNIVKSIFSKYDLGDTKIFFAPDIPDKKLHNAISAYASGLPPKEALFLIDDTIWGGAKEGIILSKDKLFLHELATDPVIVPLGDIKDIYAQKKDIYINNKKSFSWTPSDTKYSESLCSFLLELICALRGENVVEQISPQEETVTAVAPDSSTGPQEKEIEKVAPVASSPVDDEVMAIFQKYNFGDTKIFFSPRIPEQKLSNAIKAYAPRVSPQDALVLLDDTLMGGAKEGMILTRDYVFFHELLTDPVAVKMTDIESVFMKDNSLHINMQQVFKPTQFPKGYLAVLGNMINAIADLSLTNDKRIEKELAKHLADRREYYFHWLMTTLPKRSKIDSMSNSIEVFTDQFFYLSVQQGNEAWARDAGLENEVKENFDNATYSLLRLAFTLSKRVSDKLNKDKICTHIAMSDCVIHEILMGFLYRGVYLISESFGNHSDRDALIGLYSGNLFMERILAPFYQFKISNDNSLPALKKSSLQSDIGQVVDGALESRGPLRRMCGDLDNFPGYISFAIRKHLSINQGNSDSKSIIMLGEDMLGGKKDDQRLSPYCELVSACINDEIRSYMPESDEKLATIIHNFFM